MSELDTLMTKAAILKLAEDTQTSVEDVANALQNPEVAEEVAEAIEENKQAMLQELIMEGVMEKMAAGKTKSQLASELAAAQRQIAKLQEAARTARAMGANARAAEVAKALKAMPQKGLYPWLQKAFGSEAAVGIHQATTRAGRGWKALGWALEHPKTTAGAAAALPLLATMTAWGLGRRSGRKKSAALELMELLEG